MWIIRVLAILFVGGALVLLTGCHWLFPYKRVSVEPPNAPDPVAPHFEGRYKGPIWPGTENWGETMDITVGVTNSTEINGYGQALGNPDSPSFSITGVCSMGIAGPEKAWGHWDICRFPPVEQPCKRKYWALVSFSGNLEELNIEIKIPKENTPYWPVATRGKLKRVKQD